MMWAVAAGADTVPRWATGGGRLAVVMAAVAAVDLLDSHAGVA